MVNFIEKTNCFFEALPDKLRNKRMLILFVLVLGTLFLAGGIHRIVIDESIESYFKDNDPVKQAYDRFKLYFGSDEYLYIVYRAKDKDIFSDQSLKALQSLHKEIADYRLMLSPDEKHPLDHIVDVKSLINIKYMEASDNTLYSRNFVGDTRPGNEKQREILRNKGLLHPDYIKLYLSETSEYGGIVIRTDFNAQIDESSENQIDKKISDSSFDEDEDMFEDENNIVQTKPGESLYKLKKSDIKEYTPFIESLRNILDKPEYKNYLEFHPVGNPILMDFFATAVIEDAARLMSFVVILIIIMLWLLFRSFSAVVWPIAIVGLTILWIMGIIGWINIPMTAMIQVIIFLSLSVGIADAVHILSGYLFFRNKNYDHKKALNAVMKKSGLACFLTSLTTSIGLLSLTLVPLKPIVYFGIYSSVAVLLAFLFTIFVLPLMLDLWSPISKTKLSSQKIEKEHVVLKAIKSVENISLSWPKTTIGIFGICAVFLFLGLLQLKVDSNFVEIIKKGLPLRDTYAIVDEHLGGVSNMEVMLDFNQTDALKDPEVLLLMASLQKHMEKNFSNKIVKTVSLVNSVKESFKALNGDDPEKYIVPADKKVLSQVLFLFSNANPKDRRRLVSDDYSRGRIGINALNSGSIEALEIMEGIQGFIDEQFDSLKIKYPDLKVTLTGNMALLAIMLDYISWSQIKSFSLALFVISIILFLVLGSWKAGAVALAPNLFPILTTFGLMGFFKIPLDADTLLVAPIIIGLAVDDTIHFMTHFRIEIIKYKNITKAAVSALREAGQAIAFTSLILSVGFLIFLLSFHNGLSHFGIFSAIAIMTALISDLFLLPALCKTMNVNFTQNERK